MFFDPKEIEIVLQKVIDIYLIPKFHELKMNASGEWLQSLETEVGEDSGKIRGRHYTEYLAKGRPPSDKLPPVSALEKWVKVKLGLSGKQANSMAWAIAQNMKKKGSSHFQKGGTELLEILESPQVIEFIQNELRGIAQVKLTEQLQRNALDYLR